MKKLFFTVMLFMSIAISTSAQDTTMVEQYCRLIATGKILSNKVRIDVDFGEERKLFRDNRLRDEQTGRLKEFNTVVDALNYMGSQGWVLLNAFPMIEAGASVFHYYFKKQFKRSDIN